MTAHFLGILILSPKRQLFFTLELMLVNGFAPQLLLTLLK